MLEGHRSNQSGFREWSGVPVRTPSLLYRAVVIA